MGSRRSIASGPVVRSLSPCGGGGSFSTASTFIHHHKYRSASPTRVNLFSSSPTSIRFSTSPIRSMTAQPHQKKTCMCSPTNHPGSFRCSLHKNKRNHHTSTSAPYQSNRLFARRSAMTNSLVRIGTVEGDLAKRALAALIRPSSHHQRRRGDFLPTKSRLSRS